MANQWFRMYAEFAHDPKVQSMSEAMQRRLTMLLCLRCSNDIATLHEDELAVALRVSEEDLAETKALFVRKGFIDEAWNLLNWDKRQFTSDSSTERSRKHREAKRQEAKATATACNVAATPPDTETDTDKEEAKASSSIAAANDETDRTTLPCPHGELLAIFAEELPTLPQPRAEAWTGARAKSLSCRWKWVLTAKKPSGQRYATTKAEGLDFFRRFFGYVATCPHLVGENNRGWMADLGWLANETNFSKVIDGNYDRKELETA